MAAKDIAGKIVRYVIGALCLLAGVASIGMMGLAGIVYSLPFILVGAILLYPLVIDPISNALGGVFYSGNAAELPEQFSHIRIMVNNGDYDDALHQLDNVIAEKPRLVAARAFKIRLLYDQLGRHEEAVQLIVDELPGPQWDREHHGLAMMAVDWFLDNDRRSEACQFLEDLLPSVTIEQQRKDLQQRLQNLKR